MSGGIVLEGKPFVRTEWVKDFYVCDEEGIRQFARSIRDNNPLHHDDGAARAAKLLGIIAPGVMTIGFVSSAIAEEIPLSRVYRLELVFKEPVYAKSLVSVFCTVVRMRRISADIAVTVKNGYRVLAEGSCVLALSPQGA